MKTFSFLAALCLLIACSGSKDYKKQLSGNKFQVEFVLDTASPEYQMLKGVIKTLDVKMDFKEDGKMVYSASMGDSQSPEQVYDWRVEKDSLFTMSPRGTTDTYKISKSENDQIFMTKDSLSFILKKIP